MQETLSMKSQESEFAEAGHKKGRRGCHEKHRLLGKHGRERSLDGPRNHGRPEDHGTCRPLEDRRKDKIHKTGRRNLVGFLCFVWLFVASSTLVLRLLCFIVAVSGKQPLSLLR